MVPEPKDRLEGMPLFAGLSAAQLDWLRPRIHPHTFPAAVEIISAGMEAEAVYLIVSGTLKVYRLNLDGSQVILSLLGAGDTVGEMSLVDGQGRSANVITLENSRLLWMSRADFNTALNNLPRLSQNLLSIIARRLREASDNVRALASLDVQGRIARQLLVFAARYGQPGEGGSTRLPLHLSQNDLAELVGASRKRVNQGIGALKRAGVISIDAQLHITIHQRESLARLSQEECFT